jgi:hypothetical protein
MLRFSRTAALLLGTLLVLVETWRRWGQWANWPSILDDYIAGGLLLYAWYAGRSSPARSRPYLMAGWGYTLGIAYMSFFGQLEETAAVDVSGYSTSVVLVVKGFGLGLATICLIFAWRSQ